MPNAPRCCARSARRDRRSLCHHSLKEYRLTRDLAIPRQWASGDRRPFKAAAAKNANGYAVFWGAGCLTALSACPDRRHRAARRVPHFVHALSGGDHAGDAAAIFEFQTYICELTGMDIANASMYDGLDRGARGRDDGDAGDGGDGWVVGPRTVASRVSRGDAHLRCSIARPAPAMRPRRIGLRATMAASIWRRSMRWWTSRRLACWCSRRISSP